MEQKNFDYYKTLGIRSYSDQKQAINYNYNEDERTLMRTMLENDKLIYLYEYRGNYIGNEFFISFSKEYISYKLIKVDSIPQTQSLVLLSEVMSRPKAP